MGDTRQTLHQVLSGLHQSGSINLDISLRSLLQSDLVPKERLPVDLIIGVNVIFLTSAGGLAFAPDAGGKPPPPGQTLVDTTFGEMDKLGLLNLDTSLRAFVDPLGAGARQVEDHWAYMIHQHFVFLHAPDQSHPQFAPEDDFGPNG